MAACDVDTLPRLTRSYSSSYCNRLPDAHALRPNSRHLDAEARTLGDIIRRHGLTDIVGVCRLYQRDHLGRDEYIRAELVSTSRERGIIMTIAEDEDPMYTEFHQVPYMWQYSPREFSWVPLQFFVITKQSALVAVRHRTLYSAASFLEEFGAAVFAMGCVGELGLSLLIDDILPMDDRETLVEISLRDDSTAFVPMLETEVPREVLPCGWRFFPARPSSPHSSSSSWSTSSDTSRDREDDRDTVQLYLYCVVGRTAEAAAKPSKGERGDAEEECYDEEGLGFSDEDAAKVTSAPAPAPPAAPAPAPPKPMKIPVVAWESIDLAALAAGALVTKPSAAPAPTPEIAPAMDNEQPALEEPQNARDVTSEIACANEDWGRSQEADVDGDGEIFEDAAAVLGEPVDRFDAFDNVRDGMAGEVGDVDAYSFGDDEEVARANREAILAAAFDYEYDEADFR